MPSLKEYRDRIASVKSTKKITSAMKMVAASKLKKAQDQAQASQPYARAMAAMMARVNAGITNLSGCPALLTGTGSDKTHLLVVVSSDRGLCGGFNANLIRRVNQEVAKLKGDGKEVKILCIGRKAKDLLKRTQSEAIIESFTNIGDGKRIGFADADKITQFILDQFETGGFDVCTLLYNEFKSVLTQRPDAQQLIPFELSDEAKEQIESEDSAQASPYDFEPEQELLLNTLLPKNLGIQIYRALLDSSAGEQAARMTAMDNATRNAGDRINGLTLEYNRARQAFITKELIEIISGAEAV